MGELQLRGPETRAREMRNAASRLRWETEYALGSGRRPFPADVLLIVADISETLAFIEHTLTTIGEGDEDG